MPRPNKRYLSERMEFIELDSSMAWLELTCEQLADLLCVFHGTVRRWRSRSPATHLPVPPLESRVIRMMVHGQREGGWPDLKSARIRPTR
jgi:hypothetical protein